MSQINFLYVTDPAVASPIENGGKIMVMDPEGAHYTSAFISNEKFLGSVYAPEINWYIRHSLAKPREQQEVLELMYEARAIEQRHLTKPNPTVNVPRSLCLVAEASEETEVLAGEAKRYFDEVCILSPERLEGIKGGLGSFTCKEKEGVSLLVGQVLFGGKVRKELLVTGVAYEEDFPTHAALFESLRDRVGTYVLNQQVYCHKEVCAAYRSSTDCALCVTTCKASAIAIVGGDIKFSALNCTGCGDCLHACPSRALEYSALKQEALVEIAKAFSGKKILLLAQESLPLLQGIGLPEGYAPFVLSSNRFLTDLHFLTLLQETGSTLLFYAPEVSPMVQRAAVFVNEVYRRACQRDVVRLCSTLAEYDGAISNTPLLPHLSSPCVDQHNTPLLLDFKTRVYAALQTIDLHVSPKKGEG